MKDTSVHLNRRTFIASTLVGGAALATGASLSGVFAQEDDEVTLTTHDPVVVREEAGVESDEVEMLEIGDEVTLGDEEPVELDGFVWIPVTVAESENEGWIPSEYTDYAEAVEDAEATPVATPEIATPEPDATPDPEEATPPA